MKRSLYAILIIAALLVIGFIIHFNLSQVSDEDLNKPIIKIGVVTQLSGNMAMVGEGIKNAIILAEEDLKQQNLKNNYQFIIEDDAYEARKTAMIFPKLKDLDNVDAILSSFSQTGKIISPKAEEAGIIHIGIASDPIIAIGRYNFTDWTMPQYTAGRILQFYREKGFKKIVAIVANNAGSLPLQKAFMEQLQPKDGIDVASYWIAPEEKDFKMLLAKTKEEKVDAYLMLIYGSSFIPFFKEYKASGDTAQITSIETFAVLPDFSIGNGAYYTDAAEANTVFLKRYNDKFGKVSAYATGNMYDMVMLTVQAFEKAETKDLAVDELAKIKIYNGVVGKLTQDKRGIFNSNAVLKHIKDGLPVIVEENE